jgi:hypothetical protein
MNISGGIKSLTINGKKFDIEQTQLEKERLASLLNFNVNNTKEMFLRNMGINPKIYLFLSKYGNSKLRMQQYARKRFKRPIPFFEFKSTVYNYLHCMALSITI